MKFDFRRMLLLTGLLFFAFISSFFQQGLVAQSLEDDYYTKLKGEDRFFFTTHYVGNRGIGYKRGYMTLNGLFFPYQEGNVWPLLDVRGHRFTNNEYGANLGIGTRFFSKRYKYVYGVNFYYDYRSDCHRKAHFHRIGVSLEYLSTTFDIRLNGYFPINDKQLAQTRVFDQYIGGYIAIQKFYKNAFNGFNLELGVPICLPGENKHGLYLGFGPLLLFWKV